MRLLAFIMSATHISVHHLVEGGKPELSPSSGLVRGLDQVLLALVLICARLAPGDGQHPKAFAFERISVLKSLLAVSSVGCDSVLPSYGMFLFVSSQRRTNVAR